MIVRLSGHPLVRDSLNHKKGLYPNCEDGNTKLGTVLELLQWKAENAVPDKGFLPEDGCGGKKWHLEVLLTLHLGFGIKKLALSFRT